MLCLYFQTAHWSKGGHGTAASYTVTARELLGNDLYYRGKMCLECIQNDFFKSSFWNMWKGAECWRVANVELNFLRRHLSVKCSRFSFTLLITEGTLNNYF